MVRSSRDWMAPAVGMNSGSVSVATTARSARVPSCSLAAAGHAVRGDHGGPEALEDHPEGLVLAAGHRRAVAVDHPRAGSAEPVPGE